MSTQLPISRPRIAVFSGPTATIHNSQPLITSNKARQKYGLPPRTGPDGEPLRADVLRPQRLAAPVTVYVQQFSAHPLERDAAELYGPPDGYLDKDGRFHADRQGPDDVPVYEVELRPEDGLYMLPYMARQADGTAWEYDGASATAPAERTRQPFYPDASRIFEEIDRLGVGEDGVGSLLSSRADFDFIRALPPGGYSKGLPVALRTDVGEGDIPPETLATDYFPYRPRHLRGEPTRASLARVTNVVQRAMASGTYDGGIWLEGTPFIEETTYWLNLLIDTSVPLIGNSSQRPHGTISNDGDANIVDAVRYISSELWKDADGRDRVGVVVILDELIYTSREVQKAAARPGGYIATGGYGGIIGGISHGTVSLHFQPLKRHTHTSAVNMSRLPASVDGVRLSAGRVQVVPVQVKDERGDVLATAIPKVSLVKHGRYLPDEPGSDPYQEPDLLARIEKNLREAPLAGFVTEGGVNSGSMSGSVDAALDRAIFSGMPVVRTARGALADLVRPAPGGVVITANNLNATKARLLLMACLLRFGALPPAADPANPTEAERNAVQEKGRQYQEVFETH
jgi:L-asparaginase/Glu-tRNA(Gln) amidotransferase subunit D